MSNVFDAAGQYLLLKGVNSGDTLSAADVRVLLSNFHGANLGVVESQFKQWWKDNVTHVTQKAIT